MPSRDFAIVIDKGNIWPTNIGVNKGASLKPLLTPRFRIVEKGIFDYKYRNIERVIFGNCNIDIYGGEFLEMMTGAY
jgi:hypothetical protein